MVIVLAAVQAFAQDNRITNDVSDAVNPTHPLGEIVFPILFMAFLAFMLVSLIKYFLDFRLKNKLVDRGMTEQLSGYLLDNNTQEKQAEVIKLAILFCGVGVGLTMIYLTGPIDIHSLAIMAFSIGLSYLAYFFYLRK